MRIDDEISIHKGIIKMLIKQYLDIPDEDEQKEIVLALICTNKHELFKLRELKKKLAAQEKMKQQLEDNRVVAIG